MAWDESGTKREVESLKKRYPKRGIDATIPEGIRATLREREQDKLTPESKYSKGGKTDMGKSKFASGGTAKMATFTPTTAPMRVPTPEPIRVPTPMRVPTPEPTPMRVPTPEPVRVPTPTPIRVPTPMKVAVPPPPPPPPPPPQNIPNKRFTPSGRANIKREYAEGGSVSSASSRGDGCAQRGKTKGKVY